MNVSEINSELNLRKWLSANVRGVNLQWVEPSLYGSSTGAADVVIKKDGVKVDVELKHLYHTKRGIKFTLRPAQRRFHHSSMKHGNRTCLLFTLEGNPFLTLIRGDHVPLRDYSSDPSSGCAQGIVKMFPVFGITNLEIAAKLVSVLFDDVFWI